MSNLLHKARLILAGILVSLGVAAVAQIGGGSGVSAPPLRYETGSYATTTFGCVTEINVDVEWQVLGQWVFVSLDPGLTSCTSDTITFGLVGSGSMPAQIQPSTPTSLSALGGMLDNGLLVGTAAANVNTNGQVNFYLNGNSSAWTGSGNKGFATAGTSFMYCLVCP